jgi:hypothetical protein
MPEFGAWMIEAVPKEPYSGFKPSSILDCEKNIRLR